MSATIRKSDLQRIIREEYARVLLENSGHRVTEARVRLLAEKIETGELDEALSDILAGVKAVGGKALGAVGSGLASAGKAVGGAVAKGAAAAKKAGKEYVTEPFAAAASESQRKRIEAAEAKIDGISDKIENDLKNEIAALVNTTKDKVVKALGISVEDFLKSETLQVKAADVASRGWAAARPVRVGAHNPQAPKSVGFRGGEQLAAAVARR